MQRDGRRGAPIHPGCRVCGDAHDVYPAGGVLDDEERVEPVQGDCVEMEHVAGEDRLGLGVEELRPGRTSSPRRGVDPRRVEDTQSAPEPNYLIADNAIDIMPCGTGRPRG